MVDFFSLRRAGFWFLLFALLPFASRAQLSLINGSVTTDFSTLGVSSTATLPAGFVLAAGTSVTYADAANTTTTTLAAGTSGTGALASNSSGGAYNFAPGPTASATDRAVGFLATGTYTSPRHLLLAVQNNTGATVTELSVAYDIEKYRAGTRAFEWQFFTSSDGNSWTPVTALTEAFAADPANAVVNPPTSVHKTGLVSGLNLAPGGVTYLRWSYVGNAGSTNAQGLGLDNLVLTPTTGTMPTTFITTGDVAGPFCVGPSTGAAVSLPFTSNLTGSFSAQLSDATGSFSTDLAQGIIGQSSTSPIAATIPATTPAGTGYRLRVVHPSSGTVGADNGANLVVNTISGSNPVRVNPATAQAIVTTGTGNALSASASSPSSFAWFYSTNSTGPFTTQIAGALSPTYTLRGADFGGAGTYYLIARATSTCGGVVGTSSPVTVTVSAPTPTLSFSPQPVPDFGGVFVGAASAAQAVSLNGSNLTAALTLTPPAGFEIRTGAGPFACCALTFTPTAAGTLAATFDVRFVPALAQVYASQVAVSSQDVASSLPVSGTGITPVFPATVGSSAITAITATTATAGSTVTSDGNTSVTERGVVFGLSPYPTLADSVTVDGAGIGMFTSSLSALTPSTRYYVRAYATNEVGTAFSEQLTFTTAAAPLAAEPTQSATLITTSVTPTAVSLAIQGGDGAKHLLLVTQAPDLTAEPVDATTYADNAAFGQGDQPAPGTYVVLADGARAVTISGLSSNTEYTFAVFEYNDGNSPGTENYRTISPGLLTITTPGPSTQLLLAEDFAYPAGDRLTDHGWTAHSGGGTNSILVANAGLVRGDFGPSAGLAAALVTSGEDVSRSFAPVSPGTNVYAAFLVQVSSTSTADYFFHLGPAPLSTTFRARVLVRASASGKVQFGVSGSGTTPVFAPGEYNLNQTLLLVVRYAFGPQGTETKLFINPGIGEPAVADATSSEPASSAPANIGSVALRQGSNTSPLVLDGLRVATSYALARGGSGTPLPVELTAFTATRTGATVQLAWTTASEKNSLHFEVERSTDGKAFAVLHTVAAAGTSNTSLSYNWVDEYLPKEATPFYYRLRLVDADGSVAYSPVRSVAAVTGTGTLAALVAYPNPAHNTVHVQLFGGTPAPLQLLDALGRVVRTVVLNPETELSLTGLPAGVYVLRSGLLTQRLLVE